MPANRRILPRTHFSAFQEIYSGCCTIAAQRLRLLHPHKVRDDRYSTSCLEAIYASFVLSEFCELRHDGVLRSSAQPRSNPHERT
jgi:hypothetical protein